MRTQQRNGTGTTIKGCRTWTTTKKGKRRDDIGGQSGAGVEMGKMHATEKLLLRGLHEREDGKDEGTRT